MQVVCAYRSVLFCVISFLKLAILLFESQWHHNRLTNMGLTWKSLIFERGVLRFISLIGAFRLFYALYVDFSFDSPMFFWLMDSAILAVFLSAFIFTFYVNNLRILSVPFSIILLVLVSISWVNTGGLTGKSEYNLLSMIFLMAMIHTRGTLLIFVSFVLLSQVLLTMVWEFNHSFFSSFEIFTTTGLMNYALVVVLVTGALAYLRFRFDQESLHLTSRKNQLQLGIEEIALENGKLEKQKKELNQTNALLESKILQRTKELSLSNDALTQYLNVSTHEIEPLVKSTIEAIGKLSNRLDSKLYSLWLFNSGNSLKMAFEQVKNKIYEKM